MAMLDSERGYRAVAVEMRDIAAGLWLWRQPHPDWERATTGSPRSRPSPWTRAASASCWTPSPRRPRAARGLAAASTRCAPTTLIVMKPDHVRDVDLFVRWYGARAYGPLLFWRDDVPRTELEPVRPGDELPGGLQAMHDGRGAMETPLYLPEQRALVFADALSAPAACSASGTRRGTRSARSRRSARCSRSRSSTSWSRTASRSTRAPTSRPHSSASPGPSTPAPSWGPAGMAPER